MVSASQGTQITQDIKKAPSDKREYEVIQLKNGINALLIHDPDISLLPNTTSDLPDILTASCNVGKSTISQESDDDGSDDYEDDETGSENSEGDEETDEYSSEEGEQKAHQGGEASRHDIQLPNDNIPHEFHHSMAPTKKAAAAMCVGVGSFSDPMDAQGLAHFLEHMLFMGSSKFPDENEYDNFLSMHGGSSNAFTEMEYTCYHFDVNHMFLKPALDRFSQFFVSPLVKADAMQREVQAVDSEFHQVLQSDGCRLSQLKCHTSNRLHPFNRFSWGNKKSLNEPMAKGLDVRDKLLELYNDHYVGSSMKLVVLGGEPLETLKGWVLELFEEVKSGCQKPVNFKWNGPVWEPGKMYRVEAVKNQYLLSLTWALPCLDVQYLKKPHDYLSHLIGHEGAGSLLALLKEKGWATALSGGVGEDGLERNSVGYMFNVNINLTEIGAEKVYDIIKLLYEYIKMLRESKPQEWVFQELQAIGMMEFTFAEEESADDYAVSLAKNMRVYSKKDIIYGDYAYEVWDPALLEDVLNLLTPDNMRVDLLTKSFDKSIAGVEREPWFGTPYVVENIPIELVQIWANPTSINSALYMPAVNEFIPRDFTLRTGRADSNPTIDYSIPNVLKDDEHMKVWYKLDQVFKTPRANVYLLLTCKAAHEDAKSAVMTELYVQLLKDSLNETLYMATVANLGTSFSVTGEKIEIKLFGFNEKLPILARTIAAHIKSFAPSQDRFKVIKEELERTYRNTNMKPMNHSAYLRLEVLKKRFWHVDDKLSCLLSLSIEDIRKFTVNLFHEAHLEALCHGNIVEDEALDIVSTFKEVLVYNPLKENSWPREHILKLPAGVCLLQNANVKNSREDNSVVEMYFQANQDVGLESIRTRAINDLFEHLVYEPCFHQLRTKEQLGYRVESGTRVTYGVIGFCFRVQSSKYSPVFIHERINAFIACLYHILDIMPDADFQSHKDSLIAAKLEKDHSLSEETDHHWQHIVDRRYLFDSNKLEAAALQDVTKDDILKWLTSILKSGSPTCRKLIIHVWGCNAEESNKGELQPAEESQVIEDLGSLKQRSEYYVGPR